MIMKLADDAKLRDEISTEEDWNILQEDEGRELRGEGGWQSFRSTRTALRNMKGI